MSCFLPRKIASKKHTSLSHTPSFTRNFVTHIHIQSYIHTYVRMYIQTYIRTYVHAYYLFTYFHTQSFTTSFVFPSFSDPATTFETHYWKKLTCGVIRSFNLLYMQKNHDQKRQLFLGGLAKIDHERRETGKLYYFGMQKLTICWFQCCYSSSRWSEITSHLHRSRNH